MHGMDSHFQESHPHPQIEQAEKNPKLAIKAETVKGMVKLAFKMWPV